MAQSRALVIGKNGGAEQVFSLQLLCAQGEKMTTNVFDRGVGSLATDSRWSQRYGRWLTYVDDASFHKIEIAQTAAFMFAGRGVLIQQWKDWIRSGAAQAQLPGFDGLCVCAVDIETREIKICEGLPIVQDGGAFGGSGASYAYTCWATNRDAMRSVETAKALDPATGGETRYFDLRTKQHNLHVPVFGESTISAVDRAILARGIVMDISSQLVNSGGASHAARRLAADSNSATSAAISGASCGDSTKP